MKRFDLITESDARVLARGETVVLARGGHITPLALDTLRDRRVTLVHEAEPSSSEKDLVRRAEIRSVAIASDHTGVTLRRALVAFLRGGYIDQLFVAPAAAGQGGGSALLQAIEARARELEIDRLHSHVSLTAQPLFTRHGFAIKAEQTVIVAGVELRNARMVKRLDV